MSRCLFLCRILMGGFVVQMDNVEKINMVVLLCINFLTLLKNARALDLLLATQRKFRQEVKTRLDKMDNPDLF